MNQDQEYDGLCAYILEMDIEADLKLPEAVEFMKAILLLFPLHHAIICGNFEYTALDQLDITDVSDHYFIPNKKQTVDSLYGHLIIKAINEQIADCINCNEINKREDDKEERAWFAARGM